MACDSCGARRGHLGGCPAGDVGGGGGGGGGGKAKGTDGKPHRHNYITVRKEQAIVRDRRKRYRVTYYFQECAVPACPQPDKIDIERVQL